MVALGGLRVAQLIAYLVFYLVQPIERGGQPGGGSARLLPVSYHYRQTNSVVQQAAFHVSF